MYCSCKCTSVLTASAHTDAHCHSYRCTVLCYAVLLYGLSSRHREHRVCHRLVRSSPVLYFALLCSTVLRRSHPCNDLPCYLTDMVLYQLFYIVIAFDSIVIARQQEYCVAVLYCTILCCTMLFCTVVYCIVL